METLAPVVGGRGDSTLLVCCAPRAGLCAFVLTRPDRWSVGRWRVMPAAMSRLILVPLHARSSRRVYESLQGVLRLPIFHPSTFPCRPLLRGAVRFSADVSSVLSNRVDLARPSIEPISAVRQCLTCRSLRT